MREEGSRSIYGFYNVEVPGKPEGLAEPRRRLAAYRGPQAVPPRGPMARFVLLALTSALVTAPSLGAQSIYPQPGHWSCQSANVSQTVYMSAVFDETALMNEVQTGFAQLLVAKYGFKDAVFCGQATVSGSTLAGLQADWKQQGDQLRKNGNKVVETGWVFSPANAHLPYVCYGAMTVQKTHYYYTTKVLGMPGSIVRDFTAAWQEYLKGLHPGVSPSLQRCSLLPADPVAQQTQLNGMLDQWKGNQYEITPVDWTWHPGQSAAAPVEAAAPAAPVAPPASSAPAVSSAPATHAAVAASPAPKQAEILYFCRSINHPGPGRPPTYYLNQVFSSTTPPVTVNQEWQDHVAAAYHPSGEVRGQCSRVSPNPVAQQSIITAVTNSAKANKAQVIKADWHP